MADTSKFGGGRAAQFGDQISPGTGDGGHCAQCEAMLADALDGTLTPDEQALFESHMAICGPCSSMLADAQRGAAWLEMLRDPRPEPPAGLLDRILAQTNNLLPAQGLGHTAIPVPASAAVFASSSMPHGVVLPFRQRFTEGFRRNFSGHALLQPRLAMTAAMAFFSIALTMNLTGVHLSELRPADLKPSSIKQTFYSAKARSVRYYEGLRVVYELESRVHDLQSDSDTGTGAATGSSPDQQPAPAQENQPPADSPNPATDPSSPASRPPTKAPGPGSSRRESLMPSAHFVAVHETLLSRQYTVRLPGRTRTSTTKNKEQIDVRKARARA